MTNSNAVAVERAIAADDLPRDRFRVVEDGTLETSAYAETKASVFSISKEMNWVQDYTPYPSRKFEYPFAYLSASLQKGMKVLDAGCSIDPFAPFLASKDVDVFGVDNFSSHDVPWDPEQGIFQGRYSGFKKVQLYNKQLKAKFGFSVDYYQCDMASVPFPDQSFDRVFCISVLEHLPQWKVAIVFDEWRRILNNEGKVILTLDYVTKGKQNFNIGRILKKTGFALQGEVTIYPSVNPSDDMPVIVAGFVSHPEPIDHTSSLLSKLYRRNRIARGSVDKATTYYGKFSRRVTQRWN